MEVDCVREALMLLDEAEDSEVSVRIGVDHGEHSPERLTNRHGYRPRERPSNFLRGR